MVSRDRIVKVLRDHKLAELQNLQIDINLIHSVIMRHIEEGINHEYLERRYNILIKDEMRLIRQLNLCPTHQDVRLDEDEVCIECLLDDAAMYRQETYAQDRNESFLAGEI